ncbi:MAG: putative quinol monooxygenase [Promethearchaeota archaeon]
MLTIIATVKVKEGKMEQAINVLKEVVPKIKTSEPGTLEYIPHVVEGKKDANTIIFYEKYKDKEAFKIHSANLGKSLANLLPFLEPGMDIKKCKEIL